MDDEKPLLRGILEHPECDIRRLAYADWLEEHGQAERAEFCRVQCELAGMPAYEHLVIDHGLADGVSDECKRAFALRERERELMTHENVGAWLGDLPGLNTMTRTRDMGTGEEHHGGWNSDGGVWIEADFRRGFVESARLPLATLLGEPCGRCDGLGECSVEDFDGRICHRGECPACSGTGRVGGCAAELFRSQPVTRVEVSDAVIYPSGGNMTYYVGGLGQFPREYWRSLDNLPSRRAAMSALSAAVVAHCRTLAGLPPLTPGSVR
jgi:uncharacterized protein (TIGR02996 family)